MAYRRANPDAALHRYRLARTIGDAAPPPHGTSPARRPEPKHATGRRPET